MGNLCCGEVDLKEHDRRVSRALKKEMEREQRREERKQNRTNKRHSTASQGSSRRNTIQSLRSVTDNGERLDSVGSDGSGQRRHSEAIDTRRRMSRRATIAPTLTIEMPSSESLHPDKV